MFSAATGTRTTHADGNGSNAANALPVDSKEAGALSESANSGLGPLPSGIPGRPRSEEERDGGLGKDASLAEREVEPDLTARLPGENWSEYYARRAAGA